MFFVGFGQGTGTVWFDDLKLEEVDPIGLNSFLLSLNPFNLEAYLHRGRAYGALGKSQKAIDDYSMALALTPPAHKSRGETLLRRSNNYATLGDLPRAEADLGTIAELDLDIPSENRLGAARQCNRLAWRYVTAPEKQRDPHKALPLARKAVALAPNRSGYRNTLGAVYYRLGQYPEALEQLEQSLRTSKGTNATYDLLFLAMSHAQRGDAAKAKDYYERALERLPKQPGTAGAENKELDALRIEAQTLLKSKDGFTW
jgi:tetratricopeptide (TPR) repeat protein